MPRNAGRPPEAWAEGRCKRAISPFSRLHTVCLDLRFPAPENCETIKFCFLNCSAFACCRELGNESLISHSSLVASLLKLSDFIPTLRRSCHCQFPSMLKGSDQTKLSLVSLFVGVLLQVYDVIRILIFFFLPDTLYFQTFFCSSLSQGFQAFGLRPLTNLPIDHSPGFLESQVINSCVPPYVFNSCLL